MAVDIMPRLKHLHDILPSYQADGPQKPRTIFLEGADVLSYDAIIREVGELFKIVKAQKLGLSLVHLDPIVVELRRLSSDFQYSYGELLARWLNLAQDLQLFKGIESYSRKSL
jgi:hypothetical protein